MNKKLIKKGITNKGLEILCSKIPKFKDFKILKINLDNINRINNKIDNKGVEIIKKGLEKL